MRIPVHVTLFSDCLYLGDRNGGRLRLLNANVPGIDVEIILLRDLERGTGPYNVTHKKCLVCGSRRYLQRLSHTPEGEWLLPFGC